MIIKSMIVVCIALVVFCGYLKIKNLNLESEINIITNENIILKEEIAVTKNTLKNTVEANSELSKIVDNYRVSNQNLSAKLQKLDRNIDKIAEKHPTLLNKIINDSQKRINRCFENISKGKKDVNNDYEDCQD